MRTRLIENARKMGIEMSGMQADMLCEYHRLLTEANRAMNLTRVPDDAAEAVDRNYLDSITPLAYGLPAGTRNLADVGAGAGFPGIPLAIMLPEVRITLIDALDKRVKFLSDVIKTLGLNALAVHARAEEAGKNAALREQFDVVTSRAVAAMNVLLEYSLPLLRVGGTMIAYKGPTWQEETAQSASALEKLGGALTMARPAPIPERSWNHMLVYIEKTAPTPAQYPRRSGMPEKKPL